MRSTFLFAAALATAGCATSADTTKAPPSEPAGAVATLASKSGSSVQGTVTFTRATGGVRVVADLTGLSPGPHGFHVHERGDCSAPDAESAGPHFTTDAAQPHGAPDAPARHTGDLGNIEADAEGRARHERIDPLLALDGPGSIVGRAVVVHAQRDDLTTQPAGDAGGRVACGVVESAAR
jgi:superoxide dismutase, Cu-Zn family